MSIEEYTTFLTHVRQALLEAGEFVRTVWSSGSTPNGTGAHTFEGTTEELERLHDTIESGISTVEARMEWYVNSRKGQRRIKVAQERVALDRYFGGREQQRLGGSDDSSPRHELGG